MDQRYTGTGRSELDGNGTGSGEIEFGTGGLRPKTDKREAAMMMMMIYIINLSVVQHLHVGLVDVFKFERSLRFFLLFSREHKNNRTNYVKG